MFPLNVSLSRIRCLRPSKWSNWMLCDSFSQVISEKCMALIFKLGLELRCHGLTCDGITVFESPLLHFLFQVKFLFKVLYSWWALIQLSSPFYRKMVSLHKPKKIFNYFFIIKYIINLPKNWLKWNRKTDSHVRTKLSCMYLFI